MMPGMDRIPLKLLRVTLFTFVAIQLAASIANAASSAPPLQSPAGLVLIVVDALRPDDLGLYGGTRATSPALDRLAADSLIFEQASSSAPKTIPAMPQAFSSSLFPDAEMGATLMQVLEVSGWKRRAAVVNNPYVVTWLQAQTPTFDDLQGGDLNAGAIVDAAVAKLDAWAELNTASGASEMSPPWVLFLHFLDTHTPYKVPQPWAGRFVAANYSGPVGLEFSDVAGAWAGRYVGASRRQIRNLYDGAVAYTDFQIGRFLDALRERGLYDDSAILVTADHEEEFWEHGGFFHGQSLYDELLRVPMIIKLPGSQGSGKRVLEPVGLIDLVPTVADLVRYPPSAPAVESPELESQTPQWIGSSMLDALKDGLPANRFVPATVGRPDTGRPQRHGLRSATVKYIVDVADGREHLFDLTKDPGERRNRAEADPVELARLRLLWKSFAKPLQRNGYHLEIEGSAETETSWNLKAWAAPEAQLVNTDRGSFEVGETLLSGRHNLVLTGQGTVAAGDRDAFRFDLLAGAGRLFVEVRFGLSDKAAPVYIGDNIVDGTAGIDLATVGSVQSRARPGNSRSSPKVALWQTNRGAASASPSLSEGDKERLRALGYVE